MALTPAGFILSAVEAAENVRDANRLHALTRAVGQFVDLLAMLPDYPASDFVEADIARLSTLADAVIARIEERAGEEAGSPKAALELVSSVYEIRSRLEQIDIWRRHFSRAR
jgi:hypothetical protein